jgi:hypothetical protein
MGILMVITHPTKNVELNHCQYCTNRSEYRHGNPAHSTCGRYLDDCYEAPIFAGD